MLINYKYVALIFTPLNEYLVDAITEVGLCQAGTSGHHSYSPFYLKQFRREGLLLLWGEPMSHSDIVFQQYMKAESERNLKHFCMCFKSSLFPAYK